MVDVLYYFAGEKGESYLHPNMFRLSRKGGGAAVTHGDLLRQFPLLAGGGNKLARSRTFHFRYRIAAPGPMGYAWLDVTDMSAPVPTFNGVVFAKILCLDRIRDVSDEPRPAAARGGAEARKGATGAKGAGAAKTRSSMAARTSNSNANGASAATNNSRKSNGAANGGRRSPAQQQQQQQQPNKGY